LNSTNITLFHLSDEWFSGSYGLYRYFDKVVRNFDTYLARNQGILLLPEGYSNDSFADGPPKPSSARQYSWAFIGEVKASRAEMAKSFQTIAGGFETLSHVGARSRRFSKAEYLRILGDAVFAPCPMGNVVAETWRFYEALELGCIPIIEKRLTLDYFTRVLGEHPIPTFSNWTSAAEFCAPLLSDKERLDQLQVRLTKWWLAYKDQIRVTLRKHLESPSSSENLKQFSRLPWNEYSWLHEPLRLAELLRHQSARSVIRRLSRPKAPIARIYREIRKRSV
jgi:hypothetical protein